MKLFLLVLLGILLKVMSLSSQEHVDIDWVLGEWTNYSTNEIYFEIWEKSGSNYLKGRSFVISNKDTVFKESLEIKMINEELTYLANVLEQNNGQTINYKLANHSNSYLRFDNFHHDFPQTISYNLINSDSIYAEISGVKDGKFKSIPFPLKRKK